jgi:hypothetical protein
MTRTDSLGQSLFYAAATIEAPMQFRFELPIRPVKYEMNWFYGYPEIVNQAWMYEGTEVF